MFLMILVDEITCWAETIKWQIIEIIRNNIEGRTTATEGNWQQNAKRKWKIIRIA